MEIKPKDLYQFLITECRYGYSRNNHLMPTCAYEHVKTYLPELAKEDSRMALATAKQLCEECISMELIQFSDGIDDENGNRIGAIKFIQQMKAFVNKYFDEADWEPYNYDSYEANVGLDMKPRYDIYEADYMGYEMDKEFKLGKKLTDRLLSKIEIMDYISKNIFNSDSITYRRQEYKPDWCMLKEDYNKQIMTKYIFDDIKRAVIVKRGDC